MKIMIVTPYFAPAVGGLENYALNIAKGLQKKGDEVFVVTANHLDKTYREDTIDGLRVIRLPISFRLSNTPIGLSWKKQLRKIIDKENPDIINAHAPVPGMADFAIQAADSVGKPTVLTYHAATLKKEGSIIFSIIELIYRAQLYKTLKKASRIIAVSDYVKKCLPEIFHEKTDIVYNGIEISNIPNVKFKRHKNRFIFAASLKNTHKWKGLNYIIDAFAIALQENPKLELYILGDGDARGEYENRVAKLGISKNIFFKGNIEGARKYNYIKSSSWMIVYPTSENDAFPTVFTESWACKTAVIGADIGALSSILSRNKGVLVAPRDAELLAKEILSAVSNESLRNKLTVSGFKYVAGLSWDNLVKKTRTTCLRTIKGHYISRIVHITPYYPPHLGGMEMRVRDLSEKLADKGYEVAVLTSNQGAKKLTGYVVKNSVGIQYLRSISLLNTPIAPGLFLKLLLMKKPSVAHIHVAVAYFPEVAALICKIRNIPYVAHIRLDTQPSTPLGKIIFPVHKAIFTAAVLKGANKIIVLTEDMIDILSDRYHIVSSRFVTIPNATAFPIAKPKKSISKPAKLLLVGRLAKQKNIYLAIDLVKSLNNLGTRITLSIVGSGELESSLKEYASKDSLSSIIKFVGRLEGQDLINEYASCDIVLQTSFEEGFSSVLIEAMSSARPIVATDIPGTRTIVKHRRSGMLFNPYSVEELVSVVTKIIQDDNLRNALVIGGLDQVKEYTWPVILKQTEKVYNEIAK